MAAYGALVSVMQIMDQLHRHPHPPISLDEKQSESLAANVTFLQEFLEGYNPHVSYTAEADPLESRIAEAAYAAEDVIESYIVDQINLARSKRKNWRARVKRMVKSFIVDQIHTRSKHRGGKISSTEFYQGLEKVIEEMDQIKMEIKEKMKDNNKKKMGVQIIKKSLTNAGGSFRSSSTAQKVAMVGLDEVLNEMLEKMVGGGVRRQIIPIVGMGGLGKTTLARSIYDNPLIEEHFDICAWSTISQVHKPRKNLNEILDQVDKPGKEDNDRRNLSEDELGEKLYKHLIGRRYFIVMDDMWSIEAWDRLRKFLPDNENGSRIVVTTRLSNLASMFDYSNGLDMKFLDESNSWNLFSKTVFGEEICPLELEGIGKKIVEGCKGLPLSIVVIGGLLSKSEPTRENWEVIEENLNSIVNSEDNGNCLQTLYMSYNNLPVYMKPCFLYLGIFDEDEEIYAETLTLFWIDEGFIKAFEGKSLEEVAKDCIEELADRNLVLVEKRYISDEKVAFFKIHDLLRDFILKEAGKDKFLCVLMKSSTDREISQGIISTQRRIATSTKGEYPPTSLLESVEPTASSLVRTLIGKFSVTSSISSLRLLRVFMNYSSYYDEEIFTQLVNLRLLVVNNDHPLPRIILSSISFLWNLQTLYLVRVGDDCCLEIWKMPLLRHVWIREGTICVPDPPPLNGDDMDEFVVVLENLRSLFGVRNLKFDEGVLKRIPNIEDLKLEYDERAEELGDYCLHNLHRLHKLKFLGLKINHSSTSLRLTQELSLPYSLKELILVNTQLPWEEMATKIGTLPSLQILVLERDSFIGSEWETFEGQFSSLKYLLIENCDLEYWTTDNTHFPRLEHLVLTDLKRLREIPSSIGDIPTLRSIELYDCSDSLEESARRILKEQEEYGNEDIQLMIWPSS